MDICVFGAGSLGSLVGGLLAADHDVHLVGREPHVDAVRADGLRLAGVFDRRVHPTASTEPPGETDLVLVTVKSFDTRQAVRSLADTAAGVVLSLQNGMGNEQRLAAGLSAPVLAGTCTYGARLSEPGVVECTGTGAVAVGPRTGGQSDWADRVGGALAAGLETTVAPDMPRRLWEKLAVNAGINATTALARVPNGDVVDGPARSVAADAARETAQVAAGAGIDIDDAPEQTREVATATAANISSMHQDVRAGTRTEVEAINGYVVDRASGEVPVNTTLTALIRAWERGAGLR
jgi:2-dehydropantoate 2-reductase